MVRHPSPRACLTIAGTVFGGLAGLDLLHLFFETLDLNVQLHMMALTVVIVFGVPGLVSGQLRDMLELARRMERARRRQDPCDAKVIPLPRDHGQSGGPRRRRLDGTSFSST